MTSFGLVTPFDALVTLDLVKLVHEMAMSFVYFRVTLDLLLVTFFVAFVTVAQETVVVLVFSSLALPSSAVVTAVAVQLLAVLAVVLQLVAAVALLDVLAIVDVPTFFDRPFQGAVVDGVGFVGAVNVAVVDVAVETLAVEPVVDGHKC